MIFPRNPHSFKLGQAIIAWGFFSFCHLLGKEGQVGKAIEDNLIDAIKFRIRFYSIYYPTLHANDYLPFYVVHLFNEAIRQRIRWLGWWLRLLAWTFVLQLVPNLKKDQTIACYDELIIPFGFFMVSLHLHSKVYLGEQFFLIVQMERMIMFFHLWFEQANIGL